MMNNLMVVLGHIPVYMLLGHVHALRPAPLSNCSKSILNWHSPQETYEMYVYRTEHCNTLTSIAILFVQEPVRHPLPV